LEQSDAMDIAKAMLQFELKLLQWEKSHFKFLFNVNGKGECEITLSQFQILVCISGLKLETLSQLANYTHISKSSLSLSISRMVKNGFIIKQAPADNLADKRIVYFRVTPKGNLLLKKMERECLHTLADYFLTLDEEKAQRLKLGLELLSQLYDNKGGSIE